IGLPEPKSQPGGPPSRRVGPQPGPNRNGSNGNSNRNGGARPNPWRCFAATSFPCRGLAAVEGMVAAAEGQAQRGCPLTNAPRSGEGTPAEGIFISAAPAGVPMLVLL